MEWCPGRAHYPEVIARPPAEENLCRPSSSSGIRRTELPAGRLRRPCRHDGGGRDRRRAVEHRLAPAGPARRGPRVPPAPTGRARHRRCRAAGRRRGLHRPALRGPVAAEVVHADPVGAHRGRRRPAADRGVAARRARTRVERRVRVGPAGPTTGGTPCWTTSGADTSNGSILVLRCNPGSLRAVTPERAARAEDRACRSAARIRTWTIGTKIRGAAVTPRRTGLPWSHGPQRLPRIIRRRAPPSTWPHAAAIVAAGRGSARRPARHRRPTTPEGTVGRAWNTPRRADSRARGGGRPDRRMPRMLTETAPRTAAATTDPALTCRLCGSAQLRSFLDLGATPPCELFLPAEAVERPEIDLPAACAGVRELPAGAVAAVDHAGGDVHRVRLLLVVLHELGGACAAVRRRCGGAAGAGRRTRSWWRSPATTATCCSTSSSAGIRCLGIEPSVNVGEAAREKGVPTLTAFLTPGDRRAGAGRARAGAIWSR